MEAEESSPLYALFQAIKDAELTIKQQAEENIRLRSELEQKILELEHHRKGVSAQKGSGSGNTTTAAYDELENGPETSKVVAIDKDDPENGGLTPKVIILEWFFLITNVFAELLSTVLDQLSSTRNPHFALMGLLLSYIGLCFCIIELILRCIHQKVFWKWSKVPWFYHSSGNLFGSFRDVIGLVCGLCQCIITSTNYEFYRRHTDAPVKLSLWPLTFAFGLLCSRILKPKLQPSHTD